MDSMISKNLDTKICKFYKSSKNKETFREYIRNSEQEFGIESADIDHLTESQLIEYLGWLDELWCK